MAKAVWVWDLDGTAMDTLDLYRKPAEEAYAEIMKVLGSQSPTFAELKARHNVLDKQMVYQNDPDTRKPYLYTKKRFPTSLVEIYKVLSKEAGMEPSFMVMRRLYAIGLKAFNQERYRRKIKSQAFALARFLKKKGDTLIFLTKGDRRIQGDKRRALKKAGLLKYFTDFIIAADDKYASFVTIMAKYEGESYFSIGDTYAADIVPAIKAGYFGIYIPSHENWMEVGKRKDIERLRSKRKSSHYANLMEIAEKYDYLNL